EREHLMKTKFFQRINKAKWGYLFITPSYIFFIAFVLIPLIWAVRLSFFKAGLLESSWVGLKNYQHLIYDPIFRIAFRNTLLFVMVIVPANVVLSLFISVTIFPLSKPLQAFFRLAFYLPVVASGVILSLIWFWIFNPVYGLLNYILSIFHLGPVLWLGSTKWALPSLSFVVITMTLGQPIILFLASLGNIPKELYDAAKVDGANEGQQFWKITLPLLKPTTLFVLVTQTIGVFQIWVVIYLLTQGGPAYATESIVYLLYQTAFDFYKFGLACAQGIVLMIIIFIASFIQFKWFATAVEY
ncbi:sugar ABC transporter permease, partial [Candidatus Aerophobetes bacterium]|nr:sugar ABC transporter permease [Candidatus Aerophobetes bacterium]